VGFGGRGKNESESESESESDLVVNVSPGSKWTRQGLVTLENLI
jgi:hypothetical protein